MWRIHFPWKYARRGWLVPARATAAPVTYRSRARADTRGEFDEPRLRLATARIDRALCARRNLLFLHISDISGTEWNSHACVCVYTSVSPEIEMLDDRFSVKASLANARDRACVYVHAPMWIFFFFPLLCLFPSHSRIVSLN